MLKLNKCTKTKPKSKPTLIFKNGSYVCGYHCAQLSYTTQHRTDSNNFSSYPPDNHHSWDMSNGGEDGLLGDESSTLELRLSTNWLFSILIFEETFLCMLIFKWQCHRHSGRCLTMAEGQASTLSEYCHSQQSGKSAQNSREIILKKNNKTFCLVVLYHIQADNFLSTPCTLVSASLQFD